MTRRRGSPSLVDTCTVLVLPASFLKARSRLTKSSVSWSASTVMTLAPCTEGDVHRPTSTEPADDDLGRERERERERRSLTRTCRRLRRRGRQRGARACSALPAPCEIEKQSEKLARPTHCRVCLSSPGDARRLPLPNGCTTHSCSQVIS